MANASRDENSVPTLLGVSSSDGTTPVPIYANPTTHALLVTNAALSGAGVPSSIPAYIGQIYVNTSVPTVYIATGTASSANWTAVN